MTVKVSFMTPAGIGSVTAPGIGRVRLTETVALGGVTAGSAAEGEVAYVWNGEADGILAAHGSTPDAVTAAENKDSSAGIAVPAGQATVLVVAENAKISVKAMA